MATILYIGDDNTGSTSAHRAKALERLGHSVSIQNPYVGLNSSLNGKFSGAFHYKTGFVWLQRAVVKWVQENLCNTSNYDLVWIDSGELFGVKSLKLIKSLTSKLVLYNVDDPTGSRDGKRFDSLKKSMPFYDLIVVVRNETERECYELGARKVLRVFRSYDEVAHSSDNLDLNALLAFQSEVAFIGTWMPHEGRDEFLIELIKQNIPLSIWGNGWHKSKYYMQLKPCIRGKSIYGRDYVAAIRSSKICIGMLSKGNRDLHTQRSLEIPYAGGLFCAKRTTEHNAMYLEGEEAVFWEDASECAAVCKQLLGDDTLRERIRKAGFDRVISLGVGNEEVCKKVIQAIFSKVDQTAYNPVIK
ncbi:Glycosyl transferases group 1 [Cnuella takakiae]|uniref:Glycosyl transferases group 1 n=1 Tax=Cnuella takakiae TaxID=1302690 RepID=A0A1M5E267_9BACT|nr:glycosyltransferase [Cnuella takakiae]OLY93800.1 hypothetical protein BUE76_19370 [Cnuella takakiae]SHF73161.1 Glycosyl transferases group 1 [Cnuella takakiae]